MPDLAWRDAVIRILETRQTPLHYAEIAEAIAEAQLRSELGATPATTVNGTITTSLKNDGTRSPFNRIARGIYGLRQWEKQAAQTETDSPDDDAQDETGLINAFGMYWARGNVLWSSSPKLLGQQQTESTAVDFCQQRGVYLLHDGHAVVYVGRTTEQPLGVRLRQHTSDRLNGRWNRFSWFGISKVDESGELVAPTNGFSLDVLIVTMEALLIEGLEPPQNRKRGDDFRAIEFLQVEDPEIRKKNVVALMEELKSRL